jgi:hypothetical protein
LPTRKACAKKSTYISLFLFIFATKPHAHTHTRWRNFLSLWELTFFIIGLSLRKITTSLFLQVDG